jgi:hypothetical protein
MGIPKYKEPPPDPAFQLLQEQAKQQDIEALEARAQADTASMMARYGTRLALGGSSSSVTGGAPIAGGPIYMSPLLMRMGAA